MKELRKVFITFLSLAKDFIDSGRHELSIFIMRCVDIRPKMF